MMTTTLYKSCLVEVYKIDKEGKNDVEWVRRGNGINYAIIAGAKNTFSAL
jgi:hypothetical protein